MNLMRFASFSVKPIDVILDGTLFCVIPEDEWGSFAINNNFKYYIDSMLVFDHCIRMYLERF